MRESLKLGLAAILAFSSSCSRQELPQPVHPNPFYASIEREIRKNDNWVEGFITEDASETNNDGFISLMIYGEEELKSLAEMGISPPIASYNPKSKVLLLPNYPNESENAEVLNAIDHELWHTLYNSKDINGLTSSNFYKGPSQEEISNYVQVKTNNNEFDKLKSSIAKVEYIEDFKVLSAEFADYYGQYAELLESYNSQVSKNDNNSLKEYLSEEEKRRIDEERKTIHNKINQFKPILEKIYDWREEIVKGNNRSNLSLLESTLDDLSALKNKFESYTKELSQFKDLPKINKNFNSKENTIYEQAEERHFQAEIKSLEDKLSKSHSETEREILISRISWDKQHHQEMSKIKSFENQIPSFLDSIIFSHKYKAQIVADANKNSAKDILSTDEVMARIVDSLYSLYFDEVTQHNFPLNKEDLNFLSGFEYKGKKIFKKGIEKYTLGLEMIGDGVSKDEIKKQLEYSTSFTYKGRTYNWPESKFSIKGNLPMWNLIK
ncbi:MAG: hypothetical protein Q7S27_00355 [Nanoarchaeota archaeon]|nr:hypothetical protein [Nanoarchaeota archaeon]